MGIATVSRLLNGLVMADFLVNVACSAVGIRHKVYHGAKQNRLDSYPAYLCQSAKW